MATTSTEFRGVRILECEAIGAPLRNNRELNDLISLGWEHRAKMIVLPAERLGDEFFRLNTGIAGEIVQKFVNYHFRLAILGDISRYLDQSAALRDFVRESNRGNQIWFVENRAELEQRLQSSPSLEKQ